MPRSRGRSRSSIATAPAKTNGLKMTSILKTRTTEPSYAANAHLTDIIDETAVEAIAYTILERLPRAQKSSEQSLDEHRAIGEALLRAKPLIRRGYLNWAKERFGFSKQWCARLTKVAETWDDCVKARSWAEEQGHAVNSGYSVDGALALVRKWKSATLPAPQGNATSVKRQKASELKSDLEAARTELEIARLEIEDKDAKLAEALARISDLEAQLAALGGGKSAYASGQTGTVNWTSPIQDLPSEDVAVDAMHAASTNEEGRLAVTIRLGRSEHEALNEDASANEISLEALLLAKILGDTSNQGAGPSPREATELEKLLQRKGVGYVIEERIRTIGQEDNFGPDEGTVIRTYSS